MDSALASALKPFLDEAKEKVREYMIENKQWLNMDDDELDEFKQEIVNELFLPQDKFYTLSNCSEYVNNNALDMAQIIDYTLDKYESDEPLTSTVDIFNYCWYYSADFLYEDGRDSFVEKLKRELKPKSKVIIKSVIKRIKCKVETQEKEMKEDKSNTQLKKILNDALKSKAGHYCLYTLIIDDWGSPENSHTGKDGIQSQKLSDNYDKLIDKIAKNLKLDEDTIDKMYYEEEKEMRGDLRMIEWFTSVYINDDETIERGSRWFSEQLKHIKKMEEEINSLLT